MSDPPTPSRRWFQFRLRTLLIAMALLAIPLGWFGWQARIVRHRRSILAMVRLRQENDAPYFDEADGEQPVLPWYRTLLGDEPLVSLWVIPGEFSQEELRQFKDAFPETRIRSWFKVDREPAQAGGSDPTPPNRFER